MDKGKLIDEVLFSADQSNRDSSLRNMLTITDVAKLYEEGTIQ